MGLPCGFSADLGGLQDAITGQLGSLLNLRGLIGTPPGLLALQGALTGALATVQGSLMGLLPSIPFASEFSSLRDTLGDLASGITGDISGLLGDFGGVLDIDANINLNDLASSAISLGLNFDPCSLTSSIPNIMKDPAGNLFKGPSMPPFLGKTDFAERIDVSFISGAASDMMSSVGALNTNFATISNVTDGISALKNNVTGSITGMGNTLRKLPTGESVFVSQADFITDLKSRTSKLNESNFPTIFASKEEEDAHDKFVADTILRNRLRAGDNIGV